MQKLLVTLAISLALVTGSNLISAQDKKKEPKAKVTKQEKKAGPATVKPEKKKTKEKAADKKTKAAPGSAKDKKAKKAAKTKGKNKKTVEEPAAPLGDLAKAKANLSSKDPEVILEAIQLLGASGKKEYAEPLMVLLKRGTRSDITEAALFALGGVHSKNSVDLLIDYLGHRRPDARMAALYALEKHSDEKVTKAIEQALRDSDRQVRATAALSLGKRGSKESVSLLFRAFERGVTDAAISIGQLGNPEDSKRLTKHLGRVDIKIMLAGFEEFLNRKDFPEEAKLSILNRLFDLAGPEVWRFAVTYKASFPPDTDENENKLYKLVSRMVRQIKDK